MSTPEQEYATVTHEACQMLADEFDGNQRFLLLVFPPGNLAGKRMSYFSNASGPEMLAALEEAVEQTKAMVPPKGEGVH